VAWLIGLPLSLSPGKGPADVLDMTNTSSEYGSSMIIPYNLAANKTYTLQWWSYGSGFGEIEYFACMDLRIKATPN